MDGSQTLFWSIMKATVLVTSEEISQDLVVLDGRAYRHLFRARRASPESQFRLTDGQGSVRAAKVAEVGSTSARLTPLGEIERVAQLPWLSLMVPVLKSERTAWMVEKSVELGISEIRFYNGPRAPRQLTGAAVTRLERVAASALIQSHGSWLPRIMPPETLERTIEKIPYNAARLMCDVGGEPSKPRPSSAIWAIGAEGGWADEERSLLMESGFVVAGFGPTVLRAETCALVAVICSRICGQID